MARIFVNYRSNDEPVVAAMLSRELAGALGPDEVFLDSRSIPAGADFAQELLRRVRRADVMLVVVGPKWLDSRGPDGRRAIDDDTDWVRREIAEAFACRVRVVPVLVGAAERLTTDALPDDIVALSSCQYLRLRPGDLDADLAHLVGTLTGAGSRPENSISGSVIMEARASEKGHIYQAGGDLTINERN